MKRLLIMIIVINLFTSTLLIVNSIQNMDVLKNQDEGKQDRNVNQQSLTDNQKQLLDNQLLIMNKLDMIINNTADLH